MKYQLAIGTSVAAIASAEAVMLVWPREAHLLRFRPIRGVAYEFRTYNRIDDPAYKSKTWQWDGVSEAKSGPDATMLWQSRLAASPRPMMQGQRVSSVDALGRISKTVVAPDASSKGHADSGGCAPYVNGFPYRVRPVRAGDRWATANVRQSDGTGWCECKLVRFGDYHGHRAATIDVTQWRKWDMAPTAEHWNQEVFVDVTDGLPLYSEERDGKSLMPRPGSKPQPSFDGKSLPKMHMDYWLQDIAVTERVALNSPPPA